MSRRYRVATGVTPAIRTPWQRLVAPWGVVAAERLRVQARPDLWKTLQELDVDDETRGWFSRARSEESRFVLPEEVIFSAPFLPARIVINQEVGIDIEESDELAMLQEVFSGRWEGYGPGHPSYDLAQDLLSIDYLVPARAEPLAHFERPGIHRLQHASLLFRSESAAVITDPVYFIGHRRSAWNRPDSLPAIDAVLISHSHRDHFSLLSLMQFPRDTMIVVPRVQTPSILCEDMAAQLRGAGFTNVVEAPWFSTITVKDITIHVYPFYGEQPWVGFPAPVSQFRNAGNTFVIELLDRKAYLFVDSGPEVGDPGPALHERILAEQGHIDFVMGNLREFYWYPGQIDGSGSFLFCFPNDELQRPERWPYDHLVTYGPRGAREILSTLRPSHFFPYAHWFHDLERRSHYFADLGRTEQGLAREILDPGRGGPASSLATQVERWQVGDHLGWSRDGIRVTSPLLEG